MARKYAARRMAYAKFLEVIDIHPISNEIIWKHGKPINGERTTHSGERVFMVRGERFLEDELRYFHATGKRLVESPYRRFVNYRGVTRMWHAWVIIGHRKHILGRFDTRQAALEEVEWATKHPEKVTAA